MSGRGRGKKLSLDDLMAIRAGIANIRQSVPAERSHEVNRRIRILAEEIPVALRFLRSIWKDEKFLATRISDLKNATCSKIEGQVELRILLEAARLLSCPVAEFIRLAHQYNSRIDPVILGRHTADIQKKRIASERTYRNHIYRLFGRGDRTTIRDLYKDKDLLSVVQANMKHWEQGTVGVHGVKISWTEVEGASGINVIASRGRPKGKGETALLIIAAARQCVPPPEVFFSIVPHHADNETKAQSVVDLLNRFTVQPTTIRLTTKKVRKKTIPVVVSKEVLVAALPPTYSIELDVPTLDTGPIRIPGGFLSKSEVTQFVAGFLILDDLNHLG